MRKQIMRKCIATGTQAEKRDMFRVVRTPEQNVIIDLTGRQNGRGAYVLKTKEAILLAQKRDVFARVLEVPVPAEIYQKLLELVSER